jgi:hypothetical protein
VINLQKLPPSKVVPLTTPSTVKAMRKVFKRAGISYPANR